MSAEKKVADQESQYGVAKKLELLVITVTDGPLIRVRAVRQSLCEQLRIFEPVSKLELQIVDRNHNEKGWQFGSPNYQPSLYYAGHSGNHERTFYFPIFVPAVLM